MNDILHDSNTTRQLDRHLDHQQLCELLLDSSSSLPVDTEATEDANAVHLQHLQECLICAAELDLLRTSVMGFRTASVAVASHALAQRSLQPSISSLYERRNARFISPTFFWAATGVLFAAVLPISLFHHNLNPFLKPHVVATAPAATSTPASTVESDEALLDGIDQDLSAAVPTPMQPLDGTTANETDSTQNAQRNN